MKANSSYTNHLWSEDEKAKEKLLMTVASLIRVVVIYRVHFS